MTRPPIVSICIPHYNGIDLIDACIASVWMQDCSATVEITVHDDATTDGSTEHIRTQHPDVRLIESSENVGFCIANNRRLPGAGRCCCGTDYPSCMAIAPKCKCHCRELLK
jgi:GT2 family glycosyltransferase